jgi:TrmH family RNA methyltransferase
MNLGRHHPLLKRLRLLRRSAAARAAEGTLVAEGIHLAAEALAAGQDIELAVVDPRLPGTEEGARLLVALRRAGIACHEVAETVMDGLQDARSPQPVLTVIRTAPLNGRPWRTLDDPLVVVCDGLQDPGNLGAVLRSADAAGAAAFVSCGESADLTHPRTVRASMGSLFRLPTERGSLAEVAPRLRERGLSLVGTVARGGEDYRNAGWSEGACAVFFGNEGGGLPGVSLDTFDRRITVPLHPGVESLSVGAAVAAVLFEAARRRRG